MGGRHVPHGQQCSPATFPPNSGPFSWERRCVFCCRALFDGHVAVPCLTTYFIQLSLWGLGLLSSFPFNFVTRNIFVAEFLHAS